MKIRWRRTAAALVGAGALVAGMLILGPAGPAAADPVFAPVCGSSEPGMALNGTYGNLTIHGTASVASDASVTVNGNLVLAPGSCLDAFSMGSVHVRGNVMVQWGAILGLGCAPFANGAPLPCTGVADDWVGGSIMANHPLTMYLTAVTVGGNVVSSGGGPGTESVGTSFPIKNMHIHGNLTVTGWHGGWFGALRNTVGGNVTVNGNVGSRPGDGGLLDSNEVGTNMVSGNLVCMNNWPKAQIGDSGAALNTVGGHALGECAALVG